MKLICPICGGCASLEAWQSDADARNFVVGITNLPPDLQKCAIAYIGLFRPEKGRGLAWAKANKLLGEFAALTALTSVNWDSNGVKPITARIWKEAVEAVVERRPTQLKNHNYLKHTAYDMAAKAAEKGPDTYGSASTAGPVGDSQPVKPAAPRAYSEKEKARGLEIFNRLTGRLFQPRQEVETEDQKRKRMLEQAEDDRINS